MVRAPPAAFASLCWVLFQKRELRLHFVWPWLSGILDSALTKAPPSARSNDHGGGGGGVGGGVALAAGRGGGQLHAAPRARAAQHRGVGRPRQGDGRVGWGKRGEGWIEGGNPFWGFRGYLDQKEGTN